MFDQTFSAALGAGEDQRAADAAARIAQEALWAAQLPEFDRWSRIAHALAARSERRARHAVRRSARLHGESLDSASRARASTCLRELAARKDGTPNEWLVTTLGIAATEAGEPAEAIHWLEQGVELARAENGADHPRTLEMRAYLCHGLDELGDYDRAADECRDALARLQKIAPDDKVLIARLQLYLSDAEHRAPPSRRGAPAPRGRARERRRGDQARREELAVRARGQARRCRRGDRRASRGPRRDDQGLRALQPAPPEHHRGAPRAGRRAPRAWRCGSRARRADARRRGRRPDRAVPPGAGTDSLRPRAGRDQGARRSGAGALARRPTRSSSTASTPRIPRAFATNVTRSRSGSRPCPRSKSSARRDDGDPSAAPDLTPPALRATVPAHIRRQSWRRSMRFRRASTRSRPFSTSKAQRKRSRSTRRRSAPRSARACQVRTT